jgi:hypothetical protein
VCMAGASKKATTHPHACSFTRPPSSQQPTSFHTISLSTRLLVRDGQTRPHQTRLAVFHSISGSRETSLASPATWTQCACTSRTLEIGRIEFTTRPCIFRLEIL